MEVDDLVEAAGTRRTRSGSLTEGAVAGFGTVGSMDEVYGI